MSDRPAPPPTDPPTVCDYRGQEFGATYPDSVCIDGYLWDADSGDASGDGWLYTNGGDMPCPACNEAEAVDQLAELLSDDCADETRTPESFKPEALERVKAHVQRMKERWGL